MIKIHNTSFFALKMALAVRNGTGPWPSNLNNTVFWGLLECFNVVYKFLNSATVLRLRAITEQGRWELCGIWFRHLAVWPSGFPRPLQLVWRLSGQKFFSRHQDGTNTENFATSARKCCVYSQKLTWLIAFSDGYLEYILSITLPFYKCKETICFFSA